MKSNKKPAVDNRSIGRRNVHGTMSTSVGRKDNRDASSRKERIQAVKDEKERQVLNKAATEVQQMY